MIAWIRNIFLGHLVLAGVGAVGLIILTVIGWALGRPVGSILGLLLGVPVFLGFPIFLHVLVGRFLVQETESERPVGWGYLMLLGLAALFVIILGADASGALWWHLRATEREVSTLAEIEAEDSPAFYRWPEEIRRLDGPIGHSASSLHLGEASRVESSYYVVPLADATSSTPGCVWYGLQASEIFRRLASVRRLLEERSPWLMEASGLERSGYLAAVEDALGAAPTCRPIVLEGSSSRSETIRESTFQLGLVVGLAHGLPLVILLIWAIWCRNQARKQSKDS